jgi:hypothetical protein
VVEIGETGCYLQFRSTNGGDEELHRIKRSSIDSDTASQLIHKNREEERQKIIEKEDREYYHYYQLVLLTIAAW